MREAGSARRVLPHSTPRGLVGCTARDRCADSRGSGRRCAHGRWFARAIRFHRSRGRRIRPCVQIVDDILDVEGASADLGKTAGRTRGGKPTYPQLYGLDASRRMAGNASPVRKSVLASANLPMRVCSASAAGSSKGRSDWGLTPGRPVTGVRPPDTDRLKVAWRAYDLISYSRSEAGAVARASPLAGHRGQVTVDGGGHEAALPWTIAAEWRSLYGSSYVGRGGLKLAHGLDTFHIAVAGRECLDIGASTGGFTDVMLQRGAARVVALDVGMAMDWRLRQDPRVVVVEHVNARNLTRDMLPGNGDLVTIDVSSSRSPAFFRAPSVMQPSADVVALVKPQFEAGGRVRRVLFAMP